MNMDQNLNKLAQDKKAALEYWIEFIQQKQAFDIELNVYKTLFPTWLNLPAPAWIPDSHIITHSNIYHLMNEKNFKDVSELHRWSTQQYPEFWETMISKLKIQFSKPYTKVVDLIRGIENPIWFKDAELNIINSCFKYLDNNIAIVSQRESGETTAITYHELNNLSNQIANSVSQHFNPGDNIAIIMPMNIAAVAIYLGIIKAGCRVISIADSFSTDEIKLRLEIVKAKGVFTQNITTRDEKIHELYSRVLGANPEKVILINENEIMISTIGQNPKNITEQNLSSIRPNDILWADFLSSETEFTPINCLPEDTINILFSSGTTGAPKAIPWDHTTPIKCASDAYIHHNLKLGDRFCWPSNLGWMMGPWLIFATFINGATMVLYEGSPNNRGFGQCIQNQKVTHLGVVPSLVNHWRTTKCMEGLNWTNIKLFTSTGESSNCEDMLYLMHLAEYRPIIEYCGGTEIGGAYITGTVIQPCAPAAFTTKAMGIDFIIMDEHGKPSQFGEIALIGPSIGLSRHLLNKNHHKVYYEGMPSYQGIPLRRHGDQAQYFSNGYYRLQGRTDDTMNLGAIKISSAEIERVLIEHASIYEVAAVAVEPMGGGPSQLYIFVVLNEKNKLSVNDLKPDLQALIKQKLNPLFKIQKVIEVKALPRTASNKVMRRTLRDEYLKNET